VLCMLSCFDGFLYFTCGVSDLVGRRVAILYFNYVTHFNFKLLSFVIVNFCFTLLHMYARV
jgi:hypothetical protein